MLILVEFMGTRHPPTANDRVPLGIFRILLGWLTLAFILIGFVPTPMYQNKVPPPGRAPNQPVARRTADASPRVRSALADARTT
jgi:hypothetical protein